MAAFRLFDDLPDVTPPTQRGGGPFDDLPDLAPFAPEPGEGVAMITEGLKRLRTPLRDVVPDAVRDADTAAGAWIDRNLPNHTVDAQRQISDRIRRIGELDDLAAGKYPDRQVSPGAVASARATQIAEIRQIGRGHFPSGEGEAAGAIDAIAALLERGVDPRIIADNIDEAGIIDEGGRTPLGWIEALGRAGPAAAVGFVGAAAEGVGLIGQRVGAKEGGRALQRAGKTFTDFAESIGPDEAYRGVGTDLIGGVATMGVQIGTNIPTAILTRTWGTIPRAGATLGGAAALAGPAGASEAYNRAIQFGLSHEQAVEVGMYGIIGGVIQVAPVAYILRALPASIRGNTLGQIRHVAEAAIAEFGAEGAGAVVQNFVEQSYNPERGTWDDTFYQAAIGGGAGGITAALLQLATRGRGVAPRPGVPNVQADPAEAIPPNLSGGEGATPTATMAPQQPPLTAEADIFGNLPDVAPQQEAPAPQQPAQSDAPLTQPERQALRELGFDNVEIAEMGPQQARARLAAESERLVGLEGLDAVRRELQPELDARPTPPAQQQGMAVPPPVVDLERETSPRLTPEDRASPIRNDIIDDGKAIIESALSGEAPVSPVAARPDTPASQIAPETQGQAIAAPAQQDEMTRLASVWDGMSPEQRAQYVQDGGLVAVNRDGRSPAARIAAQPWSALTDQQRDKLAWVLPDPAAPAAPASDIARDVTTISSPEPQGRRFRSLDMIERNEIPAWAYDDTRPAAFQDLAQRMTDAELAEGTETLTNMLLAGVESVARPGRPISDYMPVVAVIQSERDAYRDELRRREAAPAIEQAAEASREEIASRSAREAERRYIEKRGGSASAKAAANVAQAEYNRVMRGGEPLQARETSSPASEGAQTPALQQEPGARDAWTRATPRQRADFVQLATGRDPSGKSDGPHFLKWDRLPANIRDAVERYIETGERQGRRARAPALQPASPAPQQAQNPVMLRPPAKEGGRPVPYLSRKDAMKGRSSRYFEAVKVKGGWGVRMLAEPKPKRAQREPKTLMEFIVSRGGIALNDPQAADVKALFGGRNKLVPGFGPLLQKNGQSLDRLREGAAEAGFLGEGDRSEIMARTTTRDLLDAIDREARGGRAAGMRLEEGIDAQESREAERVEEANAAFDEAKAEVEAYLDSVNIPDARRDREALDLAAMRVLDGTADVALAYDVAMAEIMSDRIEEGVNDPYFLAERFDQIPEWSDADMDAAGAAGNREVSGEAGGAPSTRGPQGGRGADGQPRLLDAQDRAPRGEAGQQAQDVTFERGAPGAENDLQGVVPGAEQRPAGEGTAIAAQQQAEAEASVRAQQSMIRKPGQRRVEDDEGGLFGEKKTDMFDAPASQTQAAQAANDGDAGLVAAGFRRIGNSNEYSEVRDKPRNGGGRVETRVTVRSTANGYPVRSSTRFPGTSVTGAPTRELGRAATPEEARRLADAEFERLGMAQQPAEPAPRAARIEDFGEKIEGARKDYAQQMRDAADVDIAAEPLAKSWPEPNYQTLLDNGADPWAVAFMHAARDEVPPKPRKSWKLKSWVDQVALLRDVTMKIVSGEIDPARARELLEGRTMRVFGDLAGRVELYQAVGHEKSLKGVRLRAGGYSMLNGVRYDPPLVRWTVEREAKATAFGNWPKELASGDSREAAIADFKKRYSSIETQPQANKQVSFSVYAYRSGEKAGQFWIGKKVGKDYLDLRGFPTAKEARDYLRDNRADLEAELERRKDIPPERKESNAPRVGHDHRNGADVTPEQFAEAFGFRGVQFGNYVEGPRRQADLNEAYDALMDLAGVLGVPARALSLNGELGLAFGARGKGGKRPAAAHYETDRIVINLTKAKGAGSLAHEWWHGLDHYFSRQRADKSGFLSEKPYPRGEGVRAEVVEAFKQVMQAVNQTSLQQRSRELDKRRTKAYWSTGREMSARSFESYIVAKLQDQNGSNDYLANIVSQEYWDAAAALGVGEGSGPASSYPYLTAAEIPAVRAAFDNLFNTIETRETDAGVAMFSRAPAARREGGPFFSPTLRAAESLSDNKRNGLQWLAEIRKQPGVKPEEVDWLGLPQWLGDRKGVTKAEVLDYIRANQVEVVETVKGRNDAQGRVFREGFSTREALMEAIDGDDAIVRADGSLRRGLSIEQVDGEWNVFDAAMSETRYFDYTLPGGENYRELLIRMPHTPRDEVSPSATASAPFMAEWERLTGEINEQRRKYEEARRRNDPLAQNYETSAEMLEAEREALHERMVDATIAESRGRLGGKPYKSAHWDEPNILAHIRFNEREVNGERVLFIEEIQSDWHQAGRKKGYRREANPQRAAEIQRQFDAWQDANPDRDASEWREANPDLVREARELDMAETGSAVPDAPLKKTWHETAFRRAVAWAAENGFDRVAWTTGETQAERFDLSKRLDELHHARNPDGTYWMQARVKGSGETVRIGDRIPEAEIENHVGKEIARRIIDREGPTDRVAGRTARILSGVDLKVGGEGMKGFYDKILPAYAGKWGKKFGAEVGKTSVPTGDVSRYDLVERGSGWRIVDRSSERGEYIGPVFRSGADAEAYLAREGLTNQEVWTLPVTPQMRETIQSEGVPLFAQRDAAEAQAETDAAPRPRLTDEQLAEVGEIIGRVSGLSEFTTPETIEMRGGTPGGAAWGLAPGDTANAAGAYFPAVDAITIALDYGSPRAAYHESFHRLQSVFLTDAEKRTLAKAEDALRAMVAGDPAYAADAAEMSAREVEAEAFAIFAMRKQQGEAVTSFPAMVRAAFNRIERVIRAVRNWMQGAGFQTYEDVFERAFSGETASRPRDAQGRFVTQDEAEFSKPPPVFADMPAIESHAENFARLRAFWDSASDVLDRQPKLKFVADAVRQFYDRTRMRLGEAHQRIGPAVKAVRKLPGKEREAAYDAFEAYMRARENGRQDEADQIRADASPEAGGLIDAWDAFAGYSGSINQEVGVKVYDPRKKEWRGIGKLKRFFPRAMRPDVVEAMRQPHKHPQVWAEMADALVAEGYIAHPDEAADFLLDWQRGFDSQTANDYFAGIEKARTAQLPEAFYDYSWDAAMSYKDRWAEHVSRIEAFGQKAAAGKDLFDDAMGLTLDDRTRDYLGRVRERVENVKLTDPYVKGMGTFNMLATGLQLGNPMTATLNLVGGLGLNVAAYGWPKSILALGRELATLGKSIESAKARGILVDDYLTLMHDQQQQGVPEWTGRFATFMLKWGGYTPAEIFIRTHAMLTGQQMLRDSIGHWNADMQSKKSLQAIAWFERNGFDYRELLAENGQGPVTDRFLRYAVNLTQGSYKVDQVPVFVDSPIGRFLFKYQKFGTQLSRMFWKNHLKPFYDSIAKGGETVTYTKGGKEYSARVRTFMPMFNYFSAMFGAGTVLTILRQTIFGVEHDEPDLEDIQRALENDGTAAAAGLMFQRFWHSIMAVGALGFFGNYVQAGKDIADRQRYRNPLDPPALSPLKAGMETILRATEQGRITARDLDEIATQQLSWYRASKRAALGALSTISDADPVMVEQFRRDRAYVRRVARRYADDVGIEARRRAPDRVGRTPMSPVNADIVEAIALGKPAVAREIMERHLATLPNKEEMDKAVASMRAAVRSGQPIRIMGAPSEREREDFLAWAEKNVSPDKLARIKRVDDAYRSAAQASGLMGEQAPGRLRRDRVRSEFNTRELGGGEAQRAIESFRFRDAVNQITGLDARIGDMMRQGRREEALALRRENAQILRLVGAARTAENLRRNLEGQRLSILENDRLSQEAKDRRLRAIQTRIDANQERFLLRYDAAQ